MSSLEFESEEKISLLCERDKAWPREVPMGVSMLLQPFHRGSLAYESSNS